MSRFNMNFSGEIRKIEHKRAGEKNIAEIQICKKNYAPKETEATFTWLKITLWEPKEFQMDSLVQGSFVAGSGEFSLRSYNKSDGTRGTSCEVRCNSMDLDVSRPPAQAQAEAEPVKPAMVKPRIPAATAGNDEPPF